MRRAALACMLLANAPSAPMRPLAALGQAATVREYRVPDGPSDSFRGRQLATIAQSVAAAIAAHGRPMLRETLDGDSTVRLVYPDALITVSGYYSSAVVCRIDVATHALGGLPVQAVTTLAAGACRASEERGWGAAGLDRPRAIGTAPMPGVPGVVARVFATDAPDLTFSALVRVAEVDGRTSVDLVRARDTEEYGWRDVPVLWRYAWFADGTMLVFGYRPGDSVPASGQRGVGLTCVVTGPASALGALDTGPAGRWCAGQVARLAPGLSGFVAAVNGYRRLHPPVDPAGTDTVAVVSEGSGFRYDSVPAALVEGYWRTGTAARPPSP